MGCAHGSNPQNKPAVGSEEELKHIDHKPRLPKTYLWVVALALGVGLYLVYPAALPYLLVGGMLLMHLGGHGHGSHAPSRPHAARPQPQPMQQPDTNPGDPATHEAGRGNNEPRCH